MWLGTFSRSPLLQLNQRGHSNTQPRNTNRNNPPLAAHALRATLAVFFLRKEKLGFNKYPVCSSYTKDSGPPPTPDSAADAPLFSLEPPALTLLKVLVKHYKKATSDQIPELRDGVGVTWNIHDGRAPRSAKEFCLEKRRQAGASGRRTPRSTTLLPELGQ